MQVKVTVEFNVEVSDEDVDEAYGDLSATMEVSKPAPAQCLEEAAYQRVTRVLRGEFAGKPGEQSPEDEGVEVHAMSASLQQTLVRRA